MRVWSAGSVGGWFLKTNLARTLASADRNLSGPNPNLLPALDSFSVALGFEMP
jgi:hypothetical protein